MGDDYDSEGEILSCSFEVWTNKCVTMHESIKCSLTLSQKGIVKSREDRLILYLICTVTGLNRALFKWEYTAQRVLFTMDLCQVHGVL